MMHPVSTLSTPDVRAARHAARNAPCVTERSRRIRVEGNGFTLVELILTIVIIGILAGIGIPAFQRLSESITVQRGVDDIVNAFQIARSMAVTNSAPVTICRQLNGSCSSSNGNWEDGWAAFQDTTPNAAIDSNGNVCKDGTPTELVYVLKCGYNPDSDGKYPLKFKQVAGQQRIIFQSNGRAVTSTGDSAAVRFKVLLPDNSLQAVILMNKLGQVCAETDKITVPDGPNGPCVHFYPSP